MRERRCDGPSLPQSHGSATFIAREQSASPKHGISMWWRRGFLHGTYEKTTERKANQEQCGIWEPRSWALQDLTGSQNHGIYLALRVLEALCPWFPPDSLPQWQSACVSMCVHVCLCICVECVTTPHSTSIREWMAQKVRKIPWMLPGFLHT